MKSKIIFATCLLFSTVSFGINFSDPSTTPYQKLESAFESAKPMVATQLPEANSNLKIWSCTTSVYPQDELKDVSANFEYVPVYQLLTIPIPGQHSIGPLLPGTSDSEKYRYLVYSKSISGDHADVDVSIEADARYGRLVIMPGPDLTTKEEIDGTTYINTYRLFEGNIIEHVLWKDSKLSEKYISFYAYCWKNSQR